MCCHDATQLSRAQLYLLEYVPYSLLYLSLSPFVVFTARLFPYLLIVVQGLRYGISASVALLQLPCACLRQFFPRIVEVNQSLCSAINFFGIQYVTFVF